MPSNPKKMAFISTQERYLHDVNLYPLDWGFSVHVFLSRVPAFTTVFPFISGSRFLSVQSYGLLMQWVVALGCIYTSNLTPLFAEGGKCPMSLIMPVGGRSLFAERGMILRIHLVFSWRMLVLAEEKLHDPHTVIQGERTLLLTSHDD